MAKRAPPRAARRRGPRAAGADGLTEHSRPPPLRLTSGAGRGPGRRSLRLGRRGRPDPAPAEPGRVTRRGLPWAPGATRALLAAGAIAAAVAIVASLVVSPSARPEGHARVTTVRVTSGVPMSEYRQRSTAMVPVDATDESPADGDAAGGDAERTHINAFAAPAAAASAAATPNAAGRSGPGRPGTATPPPTAGSEASARPASTLDADIADGFTVPAGFEERPIRLVDYTDEARDRVFTAIGCGGAPAACADRVTMDYLVTANALDAAGDVVRPEVAAERVVALLGSTRAGGPGGEPLGVVVATDVDLVGLRGEPVLLTWSMWRDGGRVRLHGDWLDDDLAYRVRATTDHDTVGLDLWVPLPTGPGPYVVRVELTQAGSAVAHAVSDRFS